MTLSASVLQPVVPCRTAGPCHRAAWAARRLALALVLGLGALGPAAGDELVLATSPTPMALPIDVAEAQGYFAAEGVKVRTQPCISGRRCISQLFEGRAQLATASELPVMFNSFDRADYAVLATFATSTSGLKIIALKSAGIGTPKHLVAKRVGTVTGTSAHYFLDSYLLFNDIDPKQVIGVSLQPEQLLTALQSKQVDAIAIWEPYAWLAQRAVGSDALVLANPRIYTETFNLIVDRRTLAQREGELVKVLRALARAERFIRDQPRAAQAILKARLKVDQAFVDATWKDFDYRLGLDQSLISTLEGEARWALREGHVPGGRNPPNYLDYVEPGPLRKALPGAVTTIK